MHKLDYQIVTSLSGVTAQQLSAATQKYNSDLQRVSQLREERVQVEHRAAIAEQVLTL